MLSSHNAIVDLLLIDSDERRPWQMLPSHAATVDLLQIDSGAVFPFFLYDSLPVRLSAPVSFFPLFCFFYEPFPYARHLGLCL